MTDPALRATVNVHTYHTLQVQAPGTDTAAVRATLSALIGGAGTVRTVTTDGPVTLAEYVVAGRRAHPVPDSDDLDAFLTASGEQERVTGVVRAALPPGYALTLVRSGEPHFGTITLAGRDVYPRERLTLTDVVRIARMEEANARARAQYSLQGVTLSPWIIEDGYCAVRTVLGADPEDRAARVAFIEKTPRVRFQALLPGESIMDDHHNWRSGPRGTGSHDAEGEGTNGFDVDSRAWCDEQLLAMGARLT